MKRLVSLLAVVICWQFAFAQLPSPINRSMLSPVSPSQAQQIKNLSASNAGSNRAIENLFMDYYNFDDSINVIASADTTIGYIWSINKRYPDIAANTFNLNWTLQWFDSLVDYPSMNTYDYANAQNVVVDSLLVPFYHENVTGNLDSILINVYTYTNRNQITVNANENINVAPAWSGFLTANSSLAPRSGNLQSIIVRPNLSLAPGERFAVEVTFNGDTANKFYTVANFSDRCAGVCNAYPSYAFQNSGYKLIYWNAGNSITGSTITNTYSSDCNGNSTIDPFACELFIIQNWFYPVFVTADIQALGGQAPVADFTASSTSITAGQSINFTDQSTNTPTSWQWSFSGGSPNTSTSQNPQNIVYANPGTYDVTLTAINATGSDVETKTSYITVNPASSGGGCDTLTNLYNIATDTVTLFTLNGAGLWGYISGNNNYGDLAKADSFFTAMPMEVNSVAIGAVVAEYASPASTVQVSVWDGSGAGNSPGTRIATETVPIIDLATNLALGNVSWIDFTTPATVTGTFYVGIELSYTPGDTVALATTGDRVGPDSVLTSAWEQWDNGTWHSYPSAWTSNNSPLQAAHIIFPELCPVSLPLDAEFSANQTTIFAGGSVSFTDLSTGNPTTWDWSFPGAATTTSSVQNPTGIVYNTPGLYDVTLEIGDGSSTDTETKVQYIEVLAGGSSYIDCDTFANVTLTDTLYNYPETTVGGYVAGHNGYGDLAKADFFVNANPGEDISSVIMFFSVAKFASAASTIDVNVWDANGTGGTPGTILASETVAINSLPTGGTPVEINFSSPAAPAGNYYVGISFTYAPGDTVSLFATQDPNMTGVNTAWEVWSAAAGGGWHPYTTTAGGWGFTALSHFILPIQCVVVPCPVITANVTPSNTICTANNGSLTAVATSGTGPYTYQWGTSPIQSGGTATGLAAGTYTVTITDANGCTGTASGTVGTTNSTISANITTTPATCTASNGTATAAPSGGATPYAYSWAGGGSGNSINGLAAGSYDVTITDANGCSTVATATVTQDPGNLTVSTSTTQATCAAADGSATATPSGGTSPYSYSWTGGGNTQTITGLAAGSYDVTVTDANGCSVVESATVTANNGTLAVTTSTTNATCGNADGSATATPTGGASPYTYVWSGGEITQTINNQLAGNYTVTVTDANGCTATATANVIDPGSPTISQNGGNDVSCFGGSDGSVSVSVTGGTPGYTYNWSVTGTGQVVTGLSAGPVSLTVTDANGCSTTFTTSVTEPASALSASITNTQNVSCPGSANGTLTVTATGGTSGYTYSWSTNPAQTGATATGLAPGNYDVTVTDANGCTTTTGGTVGAASNPVSVSVNNAVTTGCGLSDATLTATVTNGAGPFTYTWSTSPAQNGATATNLGAGSYSVTVVDGGGCSATASGTVSDPATHSATASTTAVSCYDAGDGTASVTVTGGTGPFAYAWTGGVSSTANATGLDGGTYNVTVLDQGTNCSIIVTATVSEPDSIRVTFTQTNVTCFGGSNGAVSAVAAGGNGGPYTYTWLPSGTNGATLTGLPAGQVILQVTDNNSCTQNFTVTITQPAAINLSIAKTDVQCNGANDGTATVTATGGAGNFSYTWSTSPTQTGPTASGLAAGSYTVTATDNSGCTATQSVTINQPTALTVTATGSNPQCASGTGSATASASGGTGVVTFAWSTTPAQTGANATGLAAGTYTVTATDANGCTATAQVTLTAPAALSLTASATDVTCSGGNDGTATVTVTGGTGPFNYAWSTIPVQNGATATGLTVGSYTVTVTDANGCNNTASATVGNGASVNATTTVTNATCNGGNDGSASITATGGVTPYVYAWSTGGNSATESGLAAGSYGYTVTDDAGCSVTGTVNVGQASGINITPNPSPASCNGGTDGQITISVSGGTQPYTYAWSNSTSNQNLTGVAAGSYDVTVTDANGCSEVAANLVVNEASLITVTATPVAGGATATATGGTGIITFEWSNGTTGASISGVANGSYTVTATDANGCTATATVNITGIEVFELSSFELYPNPTSGLVTIELELSAATDVTIEWFNLLGERVEAITYQNTNTVTGKFDLAGHVSGVYIAKVTYAGESRMEKVIVGK